jgi:hypothetical protein
VTWETTFLIQAQWFSEEVSTERGRPRPLGFDLPSTTVQPETLGDADLSAKLTGLSVSGARNLGNPKTTLWYQQKRLRNGVPIRVYPKVSRKLTPRGPIHPPSGVE